MVDGADWMSRGLALSDGYQCRVAPAMGKQAPVWLCRRAIVPQVRTPVPDCAGVPPRHEACMPVPGCARHTCCPGHRAHILLAPSRTRNACACRRARPIPLCRRAHTRSVPACPCCHRAHTRPVPSCVCARAVARAPLDVLAHTLMHVPVPRTRHTCMRLPMLSCMPRRVFLLVPSSAHAACT
jgi:hypothetical protein